MDNSLLKRLNEHGKYQRAAARRNQIYGETDTICAVFIRNGGTAAFISGELFFGRSAKNIYIGYIEDMASRGPDSADTSVQDSAAANTSVDTSVDTTDTRAPPEAAADAADAASTTNSVDTTPDVAIAVAEALGAVYLRIKYNSDVKSVRYYRQNGKKIISFV